MDRILVVDDDSVNLKMAEFFLKDNYEVVAALSGSRALKFLEQNVPDLILLDLHMPEMDGMEVLEKIQEMEHLRQVPVVFLTADDEEETEQKLLQAGAAGYVQKPFMAASLLQKIGQILGKEKLS